MLGICLTASELTGRLNSRGIFPARLQLSSEISNSERPGQIQGKEKGKKKRKQEQEDDRKCEAAYIGQRPARPEVHGSTVRRMIWYPYAEIWTSKMTLPSMEETADMSTATEPLLGVKTTLNRLAVKPEFSWHVLRELDLRTCSSASAGETRAAAPTRSDLASEGRIFVVSRGRMLLAMTCRVGRAREAGGRLSSGGGRGVGGLLSSVVPAFQ